MTLSRTLRHEFRALRHYNYRLFWVGQLVSIIGTWMQATGQAWLVLKITGSALALGTVTMLQFLPVMFLALIGGVVADKVPRRRDLIMFTQTVAMIQALVLATLTATDQVELWHLYVLAAVLGLVTAFDTPARQAFVAEMVGKDDLMNAVALNSTLFNMARIAGPALGGLTIATIGTAGTFYLNAVSFLGVLLSLVMMRPELFHASARAAAGSALFHLGEGLGYVFRTPAVLLVVALVAAVGTFGINNTVVVPLIAEDILGAGPVGFGGLMSFLGFGSLLAALAIAFTVRPTRRMLLIGAGALSLALFAVALSRSFPLTAAILVALGVATILFAATANTTLQLTVPDELRGRVMSIYTLVFLGSTPIGSLYVGGVAHVLSAEAAIASAGAICGAATLAALAYTIRQGRAAAAVAAEGKVATAAAGESSGASGDG